MTEPEIGDLVLVFDSSFASRVGRKRVVGFVVGKQDPYTRANSYKVHFGIDPKAESDAILLCTERQILPIPNTRETIETFFEKREKFM